MANNPQMQSRYYQLKRAEQPGDVFGPVAVTVIRGANGLKCLEHRVMGSVVQQSWLFPVWMSAE